MSVELEAVDPCTRPLAITTADRSGPFEHLAKS